MMVAEIVITAGQFYAGFTHTVAFDDLAKAKAEFDRISDLLKRQEDRTNDLPTTVSIIGAGGELSVPLKDIRSVGLLDFALTNMQRMGMKDAYPNLFKS